MKRTTVPKCSILEIHLWLTTNKERERRPRTPWDNRLPRRKDSVCGTNRLLEIKTPSAIYPTGEEAPEAGTSAFARHKLRTPQTSEAGEEVGAVIKTLQIIGVRFK